MKLNTTVALIALAFAAGTASAAPVPGQLTDYATNTVSSDVAVTIAGAGTTGSIQTNATPVDYIYDFHLTADSPLLVDVSEWESPTPGNTSLNPAMFYLYDSTGATIDSFQFSDGDDFSGSSPYALTAGSYSFEIKGMSAGNAGASWTVALSSDIAVGPLPAVPEPANVALLLAGLGLMGFMAKRRSQQ